MFNGLIREIAKVSSFDKDILSLKANYKPNLGDSVAVNGACLSVVKILNDGFCVQISSETYDKIAIENYKGLVHIEPAMRLQDRVDGHLVQGHIDAIGKITEIKQLKSGTDFFIQLPKDIMPLMSDKGSICVDGVSLTINEVLDCAIRLTIIPLTLKETLFCNFKIGRRVNIESDLLARYVARILTFNQKKEMNWNHVDQILSLY